MQTVRSPVSHPVDIDELRPTQITVGVKEVETRAARLTQLAQGDGDAFERKNVIPVVKGPKNRYYVIDHHHLCRALLLAGHDKVSVTVVLNLSRLDKDAFWVFMDNSGLVHPFDEDGKRRAYSDIPKSIEDMKDDPFRSLAGALRRKGGYAKDTTPFSEFLWADFLRRRFKRTEVEKKFAATLDAAFELAKTADADHLPGWCGPVDEGV
ncbi:MAG: ParB-like protein [Rhodomicrobium sp.]